MTVSSLVNTLSLEAISMPDPERVIDGAYAGDLLSWVMGRAGADSVWATIMNNVNVLAVATLADVAAVVICEGCEISEELLTTAKEKGVNLLRTPMPIYEFCVAFSECTK